MSRKIFVSYKYADSQVRSLPTSPHMTTARDYVDLLDKVLKTEGHIYKGEDDNESMNTLADSTISSKLGDKIFDSSVTIVLISKGMQDELLPESEQWIPWEISYSLKEQSRSGKRSKTNAVLGVVLPDENGSYGYYITNNIEYNYRILNTPSLFEILRSNMFNAKVLNKRSYNGVDVYFGDHSYISSVKWGDFIEDPNYYIEYAISLRDKANEFNLNKIVSQ